MTISVYPDFADEICGDFWFFSIFSMQSDHDPRLLSSETLTDHFLASGEGDALDAQAAVH
ncbi:hypothetical protein RMSM_07536 [Rhodopirellula maiorica SM1]|uniref:Uncharacterized protein n=1 Tax=Rhodopirellula maiorica SM1 TaxID=1265738 RepID=M5R825_9BACT|nr:hypothetical protein RMSM_07536 [Rhodopirellula maiorica SM1]